MRKPRLGTVLLIMWGLLLTAGVGVYLAYLQPARLGRTVSDTLESALGVRCVIRQVDFSLVPRAEVIIRGIRLAPGAVPNVNFRADACRAELSWLSLLRLKPVLHSVELEGAVADIVWPLPGFAASSSGEAARADGPRPLPALPPLLTGVRVRVDNSSLRVRSEDGSRRIQLSGISGRARLPGLFRGSVDLAVRKSALRLAPAPEITLDNFTLGAHSLREDEHGELLGSLTAAAEVQMGALDAALGRPVKPAYRYFPLPAPARLKIGADLAVAPEERRARLTGQATLDAVLPMNGHDTPLRVTLPYRLESPDRVRVEGMSLDIDGDRAVLTGEITGLREREPVFAGQADVARFSLSRWFGFGHKMTAGLQLALNDISGNLDFVLTPRGVRVPRLEARLQNVNAVLTGSGACENFREPDIVIDGHVADVDLNPIFPELNGVKPDKPALPPPAVPLEEDGQPSKVGYDIHLTADKASVWKLEAGRVDCRITPVPLTAADKAREAELREAALQAGEKPPAPWKSAGHGALLTVNVGDVYGGKGEAVVRLDDVYRVQATLNGVSAQAPVTRMAGYAALGGTLKAKADLSFSGSSAAAMMANLAGTVDATLTKGFIGSKSGARMPYRTLTVKADAKAAPVGPPPEGDLPATMPFSGTWQASLDTNDWTVSGNSRAAMTFSLRNGLPLSMTPQSASLRLRLDKTGIGNGGWPEDVVLDLKGRLSFDFNAGTLALADLSGGRAGLALGGSLRVSDLFGTPVTEGRMSVASGALRVAAAAFGLSLPATLDPAAFGTLNAEADVRYSGHTLTLKNMSGALDKTSLTGSMTGVFGQRPFWTVNMRLGRVDGDAYWPAPSKGPATPVQTEFLLGYDADIRLNVEQFTLFATPTVNLSLPLTLKQGILNSGVFTGSFPGGGTLNGTLHGETKAGKRDSAGRPQDSGQLGLRLQLRLNNVAMLPLTRARGQETLLAGTGTGQCDVQATLRTWNDIPGKLDGNWSIAVRDGYLMSARAAAEAAEQARAGDGSPSGFGMESGRPDPTTANKTPFQILSASGSLLGGVIHSNNFRMEGVMLSVKGGGSINLNTMTIAAKATATLMGVPEMPVEISGSLSDPQTSYKLMGALAGTIGNIGGTVVDIVGGVLTAPFRLFMGKKSIQ